MEDNDESYFCCDECRERRRQRIKRNERKRQKKKMYYNEEFQYPQYFYELDKELALKLNTDYKTLGTTPKQFWNNELKEIKRNKSNIDDYESKDLLKLFTIGQILGAYQ